MERESIGAELSGRINQSILAYVDQYFIERGILRDAGVAMSFATTLVFLFTEGIEFGVTSITLPFYTVTTDIEFFPRPLRKQGASNISIMSHERVDGNGAERVEGKERLPPFLLCFGT
jgi:hypothetical protein